MRRAVAHPIVSTAAGFVLVLCAPAHADNVDKCTQAYERGQETRARGELLGARDALNTCITSCPAPLAKDCRTWLADVTDAIPSLRIQLLDSAGNLARNATLTIDGKVHPLAESGVIELEPGTHKVRAEAPNAAPVEAQVDLLPRDKGHLVVLRFAATAPPVVPAIPPSQQTSSTSPWVYGLGAVGVAALGAGAFFGFKGRSTADDLRASCKPNCTDEQVSDARRSLIIADISLGVGILSIGVATWMYLHPTSADVRSARQLTLSPAAGGGWSATYQGVF